MGLDNEKEKIMSLQKSLITNTPKAKDEEIISLKNGVSIAEQAKKMNQDAPMTANSNASEAFKKTVSLKVEILSSENKTISCMIRVPLWLLG